MNVEWITVKEAANCLKLTEKGVYYRINNGKLEYKYTNGKNIRIPLESLPQEAQIRYRQIKQPLRLTEAEMYKLMTTPQIEEVMKKLLAVTKYRSFMIQNGGTDCRKEFLQGFCKRYSYIDVNESKLKTWFEKYNAFGAVGLAEEFLYSIKGDDNQCPNTGLL